MQIYSFKNNKNEVVEYIRLFDDEEYSNYKILKSSKGLAQLIIDDKGGIVSKHSFEDIKNMKLKDQEILDLLLGKINV